MSSFERVGSFGKAMDKYFRSGDGGGPPNSSSKPPTATAESGATQACEEHGVEMLLSETEETIHKKKLTRVTLDFARLKSQGIVTSDSLHHQTIEEYRDIKRLLLQNAFGQGGISVNNGNLVMVTSAVAGEGKTFTSVNLSLSIARELDRTVLLIDADVIRQGASRMLGIDHHSGLTDLLSNPTLGVNDVLVSCDVPKLKLLPAGQGHPNVAELMASENMRHLMEEMAKRYGDRLILFDAPPLLAASEARVLAGLVGQILLVVEAESTTQYMVQEAVSKLDKSKAIGLVLNKSRQRTSSNYFYGPHQSVVE